MSGRQPILPIGAAEATWLAVTTLYPHPRGRTEVSFRRYGHVIAALHFAGDTVHLQRVESLAPGSGAFQAFLIRLRHLADAHGLRVRGNALAYATPEVPVPDQVRLEQQYERCGFRIGPAPIRTLEYGVGVTDPQTQVA